MGVGWWGGGVGEEEKDPKNSLNAIQNPEKPLISLIFQICRGGGNPLLKKQYVSENWTCPDSDSLKVRKPFV